LVSSASVPNQNSSIDSGFSIQLSTHSHSTNDNGA
jgi:hypothetical protein